MEFECDNRDDERECVAFIGNEGDLIIKLEDGTNMVMRKIGDPFKGSVDFDVLLGNAVHKFYLGDKVTITF